MNNIVFKVSQVNDYIKKIFESEEMLHNIRIVGEVGSLSLSGKSIYFNLKDDTGLLSCVCFDSKFGSVLTNGAQVIITATPNYYAKGGKLSFIARNVEVYGQGLLYQQFLELKQKLENEGLFDVSKKKELPRYIKRIGVVTSNTGAVIQDIINVTTRRNDGVDIVLYPVKVQGVGADFQICKGIEFFSKYENVDVVIVARGGGSFEDLMPFNTEMVARACFNCTKPIVSAVGHETDFTIIDFVSDLRAPTPSAAAELVVFDKFKELTYLNQIQSRIENLVDNILNENIKLIKNNLSKLIDITNHFIENQNLILYNKFIRFNKAQDSIIKNIEHNLQLATASINAYNPNLMLKRGYSIIEDIDGKIIDDINNISIGQTIKTNMSNGYFYSCVNTKD